MSSVCRKLSLHGKALLDAIERLVHRDDKRGDFRGQILFGESNRHGIRADRRGHLGNLPYRL